MHPENYRGRLDVTSRLPAFLMLSPEAGSFTKAKESTLLLYMKESPCLRCSLESRRFFTRLSSAVLSVCYMSPAITTSDRELSTLSRLILTQIKDMTKWSLKYTFRGEVPGKIRVREFSFQLCCAWSEKLSGNHGSLPQGP